MRERVLFLLAAAAVFPLSVALAGDPPKEGAEPIDKDARILARLTAALPPGDRSTSDVVKALEASETPEDRDAGFGIRRIDLAIYGESLTAWVRLLSREGKIAAASVRLSTGAEAVEALRKALVAKGGDVSGIGVRSDGALSWIDAARTSGMRAAVEKGVGLAVAAHPATEELTLASRRLEDPLASHAYGLACSEGGDPPSGRGPLEEIVKAGDAVLLENVLVSPNPEGRVYAAEGLLRLRKSGTPLPKAVEAAIEVVRTSSVPIRHCEGCEFGHSPAKELLAPFLAK